MPSKTAGAQDGAPQARRSKKPAKPRKTKRCTNVANLPSDLPAQVRKKLVEGGSFEDVAEFVNDSGDAKIETRAVERYFRGDVKLQRARFSHQWKVAKKLRETLGSKPDSVEADFAFAVLVEGLSGLSRGDRHCAPAKAVRVLKDRSEERFKKSESRRRNQRLRMQLTESQARVDQLEIKMRKATCELERLNQLIERPDKDKVLGPEVIARIHQIYGIITDPTEATRESGDAEAS